MKKINIELDCINKIDDTFINKFVEPGKSIIKVTQEVYYELYEKDEKEVISVVGEWFDKFGSSSHAYRDGSRIPFVNMLKAEIVKRK